MLPGGPGGSEPACCDPAPPSVVQSSTGPALPAVLVSDTGVQMILLQVGQ